MACILKCLHIMIKVKQRQTEYSFLVDWSQWLALIV